MNQNILDEIADQDYLEITNNMEQLLLDRIQESNSKGVVLGLSGGIDSAVLAYLCGRIIRNNTLAIIMPDTGITPSMETKDALRVVAETGINHKVMDINLIVNQYLKHAEPHQKALGNLRARIRTNILYYHANAENLLVLGTSDKSEYLIGYFTKFGDGAADLTPIITLYKTQVRRLAAYLGVYGDIISKKSSPHLWKGHAAEDEIGATYEEIDAILYCLFDKGIPADKTADMTRIDITLVEKIRQASFKTAHKRELPYGQKSAYA